MVPVEAPEFGGLCFSRGDSGCSLVGNVGANVGATGGPEAPSPKRGWHRRHVPVEQTKELVANGTPKRQVARLLLIPEATLRGALKGLLHSNDEEPG